MNDYKICRDAHVLNNKKIIWEIILKKLKGFVALGISGKRPEEQGTVILDNDNENNEKIEEEIIKLENNDSILSSPNMQFLLTNEKSAIILKNGGNYKKTNNDLPVLKEGDSLTLILNFYSLVWKKIDIKITKINIFQKKLENKLYFFNET